jgi:hypothetical protein
MTESPRPKTHCGAVSQRVLVDLIGAETSCVLAAELCYDVDDPYAVTVVFASDEIEVRWTFGRDLLLDGLDQPSGEGDVHLRPCLDSDGHAVVLMELHSVGGEALVQVRACDIRSFGHRILSLVPRGTESQHLNIDAAVSALLLSDRSN